MVFLGGGVFDERCLGVPVRCFGRDEAGTMLVHVRELVAIALLVLSFYLGGGIHYDNI